MSFRIFQFSSPDSALFCLFLAAPGKFHHRVAASSCGTAAIPKLFTRHALPSPHRAPGSFSEPTQTLSAARPGPPPLAHLRIRGAVSRLSLFAPRPLPGCRVPHSFAHFANEWALSALYSFGRPHLGAARPRIAIYLFPARRHRLLGQQPVAALLRTLAKRILDDSVFERMKANHHQPSARLQHSGRRLQQCFQIVQFTVYEYSESLKGSRRLMNPLMFPIH